jgi:glycosyltransferase involved in cell wall biosynthesis
MRRLAIVEYIMSAGGVERVLRGLAGAFLEIPEARGWDVTFLLSRYNSANRRCEWPAELTGPRLHVEWLGEHTAASRMIDPLAHAQGIGRMRWTRVPGFIAGRAARRLGPMRWRAHLGDPFSLVAANASRFDLLYFTYPVLMFPPPASTPMVTTPQDFNFLHFFPPGHLTRTRQEAVTRAWLGRSDRVLLTTDAVLDEMRRFYPEHVSKAHVARLGIEAAPPVATSSELDSFRRFHALPSKFVLMAGWVMEHKNQLALVDAIVRLRERGRQVPMVFVGPNAVNLVEARDPGFPEGYAGRVRAALRESGLVPGRDFHVLGYVSDSDVQKLYRLATVFVLPSLYEGFGLPSLEALRAACPTIVSAIPPLLEQARLLGGGVPSFDPADPAALADRIAWVLDHEDEARASARATGERVPDVYDWRKTARAYLAHFAEVIEERRRSGP